MSFPNPRITPGSVFAGSLVGDHVYFDDFHTGTVGTGEKFSTTANQGPWLATQNGSSSVLNVKDGEPGGVLQIDGAGTTTEGWDSIQLNGESWKVSLDRDIYFECRIKTIEPTAVDMFMGLTTTDTNIMTGTTEAIGFGTYDTTADLAGGGTGDIYTITKNSASGTDDNYTNNTTLADSGINLAVGFTTLAFHVLSSQRVKFYIDGNEKASVTTNIPIGDAVTLTMGFLENSGSDPELLVDYIYCSQVRGAPAD